MQNEEITYIIHTNIEKLVPASKISYLIFGMLVGTGTSVYPYMGLVIKEDCPSSELLRSFGHWN